MKRSLFLYSLIAVSITIIALVTQINTNLIFPIKAPFSALSPEVKKQITCLAENIYFEAAHEPLEGKKAVAFVTLNRLQTGNYANTICGVVQQKTGTVCQFSWYCEAHTIARRLTIKDTLLYNEILELSTSIYLNFERMTDVTNGATYYHADYVNPGWNLKREKQIGRHIFYKSKGDKIDREKGII
jgi:spore germination cell wall hydrolase CwlJ-like protein